jgi:H/ACA ribonucleoprotein complex subunit 4
VKKKLTFNFILVLGEKKKSKKTLGDLQGDGDFVLEPSEKPATKLDCSQWPLLLKVCFS